MPRSHPPAFYCNTLPDKIHGIEASIGRFTDVRLSNIRQTMGSSIAYANVKPSLELLQRRVERLEACSDGRVREMEGIRQVWAQLQADMLCKLDQTEHSIQQRMRENVLHKFEGMEAALVAHVLRDFSFLRLKDFDAIGAGGGGALQGQAWLSSHPAAAAAAPMTSRPSVPLHSPSAFFAGACPATLPLTTVPPAVSGSPRAVVASPLDVLSMGEDEGEGEGGDALVSVPWSSPSPVLSLSPAPPAPPPQQQVLPPSSSAAAALLEPPPPSFFARP
jgi:hypothetical protein